MRILILVMVTMAGCAQPTDGIATAARTHELRCLNCGGDGDPISIVQVGTSAVFDFEGAYYPQAVSTDGLSCENSWTEGRTSCHVHVSIPFLPYTLLQCDVRYDYIYDDDGNTVVSSIRSIICTAT